MAPPFAEYPAVTAKFTDNLTDYAGGTHLYKWVVDISMQIALNAYEKYHEKKEVSLWKITWWPD